MFGSNITNTWSISKILTGLSKVLGLANQAIPIYKEIKPLASNAKKVFNVIKDFKYTPNNKTTINASTKEKIEPTTVQSNPQFFQ